MAIENLRRDAQRIKVRRCWLYLAASSTLFETHGTFRLGEMKDLVMSFSPIIVGPTTTGLRHMVGADMSITGTMLQTGDAELDALNAFPLLDSVGIFTPSGLVYALVIMKMEAVTSDLAPADIDNLTLSELNDLVEAGLALSIRLFDGLNFVTGGTIDFSGGESGIELTITKSVSLDEYASILSSGF